MRWMYASNKWFDKPIDGQLTFILFPIEKHLSATKSAERENWILSVDNKLLDECEDEVGILGAF